MVHCLVAAGTSTAASAGGEVARAGGNAVDAAAAAVLAAWVCEPGVTAMGSAVLAMVRPAQGGVFLVDGVTVVPGLGGHVAREPGGTLVTMPYGPGVETGVGVGSIAVPGGPAALELVQQRWGRLAWAEIVEPARGIAADGFPLPQVSASYLPISGEVIYDLTPGCRAVWRAADGRPYQCGDTVVMPDLAADLGILASEGSRVLYDGTLGHRIADWIIEQGGALSREDLALYTPEVRQGLTIDDRGWTVTTADTIGGQAIVALIEAFADIDACDTPARIAAMTTALMDRDASLRRGSGSTTQVCAVDAQGNACTITSSTGYGSGVVVPGTGILLNNMLGELELLPGGVGGLEPGQRLPSNMAPTIAVRDEQVIATGSGGAARIPSAVAQVLGHLVRGDGSAQEAVDAPRFHVRQVDGVVQVHHEPGIDPGGVSMDVVAYDEPHMFFGGVQVARRTEVGTLDGGGDSRRGGAVINVEG